MIDVGLKDFIDDNDDVNIDDQFFFLFGVLKGNFYDFYFSFFEMVGE